MKNAINIFSAKNTKGSFFEVSGLNSAHSTFIKSLIKKVPVFAITRFIFTAEQIHTIRRFCTRINRAKLGIQCK